VPLRPAFARVGVGLILAACLSPLAASAAIYVALTGSDLNPGTAAMPVRTIARGIQYGGQFSQPVFVSNGNYNESVVLATGVSIYGGYNALAGWTRDVVANPTIIVGGTTAVTGNTIQNVTLDGLTIRSANATAGGSSMAVFLATCTDVTLNNCRVQPGSGSTGTAGGTGPGGANGQAGTVGNPGCENSTGFLCSTCALPTGGTGGTSGLGAGGGKGGDAGLSTGAGVTGAPGQGTGGGAGGTGGASLGAGLPGGAGAAGSPGTSGVAGLAIGSFTVAGYTPAAGGTGTAGTDGAGGGGGGGGGGGTAGCDSYGSSGGGGGAGGEHGSGGGGGAGGGGSFGVVTTACDRVIVQQCAFTTQAGGAGGAGGVGGAGGNGGQPGPGGPYGGSGSQDDGGNGAAGGAGGNGGNGGAGGGGGGGPTIGIVHASTGAMIQTGNTFTLGAPGAGGTGPAPGATGMAANVYAPFGTVAVEAPRPVSADLELACAPNPFGDQTRIDYALPNGGRVSLAVHDLRGAIIASLADGVVAAGRWSAVWDGRDANGRRVPAGIYFARLAVTDTRGSRTQVRKLVMAR